MQKLKRIFVLFLSVILVFSCTLTAFADWRDLMINTDSNVRTFALPRSSIESVTNTIDASGVQFYVYYNDASTGAKNVLKYGDIVLKNGRFEFSMVLDEGDEIVQYGFQLRSASLPSPGDYTFSFDIGSDFSLDYKKCNLYFVHENKNASNQTKTLTVYPDSLSGDVYLSPMDITMNSLYRMNITMYIDSTFGNAVGGDVAFNFTVADVGSDSFVTPGSNTSTEDFQSGLTDSFDDLSSSVDSMTEDLSSAAENLEYISTSQNLIIQGIDNVVMHISDQLFAFWNQLFNLIHVPTMAKMDDIIDAIRNMDLEIEVNLDGLKQSIQQASQNEIANDNKVSADQIANNEANTEEVKDAVKEHGNFIIDGLKGLFIPSDEFFKAYFDDLYAYFSDRFGFLSFPIDLVIRIADLFLTSEKVDAVLTLPSFEISGYKVWDDYSFNFTEFLETSFPFLISAIQTVTSIGLIMAFVNLCQDKWNEVMRS